MACLCASTSSRYLLALARSSFLIACAVSLVFYCISNMRNISKISIAFGGYNISIVLDRREGKPEKPFDFFYHTKFPSDLNYFPKYPSSIPSQAATYATRALIYRQFITFFCSSNSRGMRNYKRYDITIARVLF